MCFAAGDTTDGVHLLCPGSHCRLLRCCPSPLGSDGGETCAVWFVGIGFKDSHLLLFVDVFVWFEFYLRNIVHGLDFLFGFILQQEAELCSATAQFEDFVLEFLNR